jgi:hypothetical protein
MGLVAGKSDVVAMVLKDVLSEPGLVFGFGLHGKVFLVLTGWAGFANATYCTLPQLPSKAAPSGAYFFAFGGCLAPMRGDFRRAGLVITGDL